MSLLCFLLALVLEVVSCGGSPRPRVVFGTWPPGDTAATNETRRALGLRLIDANRWHFHGTKTCYGFQSYQDGTKEAIWKTSRDGYECKKVVYAPDGRLSWEEDYWYTGRTYTVPNDPEENTGSELLSFHYDYMTGSAKLSYCGLDKEVFAIAGRKPDSSGSVDLGDAMQGLSFDGTKALRDRIIAHWVATGILPAGTASGAADTPSTAELLKNE